MPTFFGFCIFLLTSSIDFPIIHLVYGDNFCYINGDEFTRTMKTIIIEQGPHFARINATHCMDMLASEAGRDEITPGEKILWMATGCIKFRYQVY